MVGGAGVRGLGEGDVGAHIHRDGAFGVDQGDVLRYADRDRAERGDGLADGVAGLQEIAQHDEDAEAGAVHVPAAEGEGDGESGVVHPVQQPPPLLLRPDHGAQEVGGDDGAFALRGSEVVVAQQGSGRAGLCAAGEERPQRGMGQIGFAAGPAQLGGEPVEHRDQFRQARLEEPPGPRRARRRTSLLAQPALGDGPPLLYVGRPAAVTAVADLDGAEGLVQLLGHASPLLDTPGADRDRYGRVPRNLAGIARELPGQAGGFGSRAADGGPGSAKLRAPGGLTRSCPGGDIDAAR